MFHGSLCHYISPTEDQWIGRNMGSMTLEEYAEHLMTDATRPEHLDAIAFQFLCMQRRLKTMGLAEGSARWKAQRIVAETLAAEARARLAEVPNTDTHPGFFDRRSATPPGMLHCDMHLPFAFSVDLGQPTMSTGIYEPVMVNGETYKVVGCRNLKAVIEPASGGRALSLDLRTFQALTRLGRIRAVPLSTHAALKRATLQAA